MFKLERPISSSIHRRRHSSTSSEAKEGAEEQQQALQDEAELDELDAEERRPAGGCDEGAESITLHWRYAI